MAGKRVSFQRRNGKTATAAAPAQTGGNPAHHWSVSTPVRKAMDIDNMFFPEQLTH
jgi:hypothetical protein